MNTVEQIPYQRCHQYYTLVQGYSITIYKGPFTEIQSLPRSVHSREKLQHNTEYMVTNTTHVTRTKHVPVVIYCSTSQLVGEMAFLVSC